MFVSMNNVKFLCKRYRMRWTKKINIQKAAHENQQWHTTGQRDFLQLMDLVAAFYTMGHKILIPCLEKENLFILLAETLF